jgi:hypothetical protein
LLFGRTIMSGLSNYSTTTLKAAPAAFFPRDDGLAANNGSSSNGAVTNNIRGSQQRMLSKSFGGEDPSSLLKRISALPQGNNQPLQRYAHSFCWPPI